MDRREALKRVAALLGYAVSTPAVEAVLAGWEPANRSGAAWTPGTLSPEQAELVATIAEIILPATDTPGAKAARVEEFIDAVLTGYDPAEAREAFLAGLRSVDERARETHGLPFLECTAGEQAELVAALDRAAFAGDPAAEPPAADAPAAALAAWYRRMKELTLDGYYTSEIGATQELRASPWGRYRGDIPYAEIGRSWS